MCTVEFPKELRGKFVAWRLEKCEVKIVAADDDFFSLLRKLRETGVDPRFVFIDYVPDEEIIYLLTSQPTTGLLPALKDGGSSNDMPSLGSGIIVDYDPKGEVVGI